MRILDQIVVDSCLHYPGRPQPGHKRKPNSIWPLVDFVQNTQRRCLGQRSESIFDIIVTRRSSKLRPIPNARFYWNDKQ